MFQIAVLGPQFADRLGIVQQCMQCRAAAGLDAPPCPGFGPGCLMTPRVRPRDPIIAAPQAQFFNGE
jgi:hypothetical protein